MKEASETKSTSGRRPSGQGAGAALSSAASAAGSILKSATSDAWVDIPLIAQRLINGELQAASSPESAGRAAFRVCEKLRQPLSGFIGVVGFRSLFARALTLAQGEVPWLRGVEIRADGALVFSMELEAQLDSQEAVRGGAALIAQLLGLLITFIGEGLTLRLVYNVWPDVAAGESGPKEKRS